MNKKNKVKRTNAKAQKARLLNEVKEAREMVKGHEQLAKVHSAYIAILLKRLGATKDNPITITAEETKEAINNYEARASIENGNYNLWCEVD